MHIKYDDITSRIAEPAVWWLNGVPRYRSFAPDDLGVYAREVALMRVECQMCLQQFDLGLYAPSHRGDALPYHDDPPRHSSDSEDDCAGSTMGYTEVQILEFWRQVPFEPSADPPIMPHWIRDHEREIILRTL